MTSIDPAMPSAAVSRMSAKWELPQALMGGTAAMRLNAFRYLPKHPAESGKHYHARLQRSVLRNFFRRSVQTLTGKAFARPIMLGDNVPARLAALMEDVDLTGRNLHAFARDVFADALVCGLSHVLVDYPRVAAGRTLAEERDGGARPYAVHIRADQVIGWRADDDGGRPVLSQLRLREQALVADGAFGERPAERIRVLEPGAWTLWQRDDDGDWAVVDSGHTSLPFIPLVTVYTGRTGFMEAEPPLEDLAWLNLEHWQRATSSIMSTSLSTPPSTARRP